MSASPATDPMTAEEIVAPLARAHLLLVVRPGRPRPDRDRPRRGDLPLHPRGPADHRLQQPADVREHRPRRPPRRSTPSRSRRRSSSTSSPAFATETAARLGAKLAEILPGDLDKVFFTLGGAEAIENAIKLARHYTGRHKVLARYRSYHGATLGAMTLTGDPRRWANEPGVVRRRPLPRHPPLGREGAAAGRRVASRASRTSSGTRARTRSPRSSSRRSSAPTASSSRPTATSRASASCATATAS